MDEFPNLPIREQFSPYGESHDFVIVDYDGNYLDHINFLSLGNVEKNYIIDVLEDNYNQTILGDINGDTFVNIQDVPTFFANENGNLHWLHGYFISFIASVGVMLLIGKMRPKTTEDIAVSDEYDSAPVDMTPWPQAKIVSCSIIGATVFIYLILTWAST